MTFLNPENPIVGEPTPADNLNERVQTFIESASTLEELQELLSNKHHQEGLQTEQSEADHDVQFFFENASRQVNRIVECVTTSKDITESENVLDQVLASIKNTGEPGDLNFGVVTVKYGFRTKVERLLELFVRERK